MKLSNKTKPTLQYSLIQGFFWSSFGALIVYSSVYLLDKGFQNRQIGYIMAFGYLLSVFLQPLIGGKADSSKKMILHRLITILSLVTIVTAGLILGFSKYQWLVGFLYGLLVSYHQVIIPLTYSIGIFFIDRGVNIDFGISRAIGSLAFAASSALVGILVEQFSTNVVIYTIIIVFLALIFFISKFHFEGIEEVNKIDEANQADISLLSFFKKYKKITIFFIGSILLFTSYNLMGNYMFQIVSYHGYGEKEMGLIISLGAILELPALFGLSFLMKRFKSGFLMRLSVIAIFIRALVTYLASSIGGLYFSIIFQTLGYGLFAGINVYYIAQVVDERFLVRGQSLMNTTITLGSVIASVIGGILLDSKGVPTMLLTSAIFAGIGALIMFVTTEEGKKVK